MLIECFFEEYVESLISHIEIDLHFEHYNSCIKVINTAHKENLAQHFNIQLTHTTLKNVELLKHFKISKTAPTCFGLQRNHHQGATVST